MKVPAWLKDAEDCPWKTKAELQAEFRSERMNELRDLQDFLARHSMKSVCASQRSHEGYEGTDLSYRLLLRDPERMQDLLAELKDYPGVSRVTGLKAEEQSEV